MDFLRLIGIRLLRFWEPDGMITFCLVADMRQAPTQSPANPLHFCSGAQKAAMMRLSSMHTLIGRKSHSDEISIVLLPPAPVTNIPTSRSVDSKILFQGNHRIVLLELINYPDRLPHSPYQYFTTAHWHRFSLSRTQCSLDGGTHLSQRPP
jgi:hypothetical protein